MKSWATPYFQRRNKRLTTHRLLGTFTRHSCDSGNLGTSMLLLDCSQAKVPEEGLLSQKIWKIPEALCRVPFLSLMFLPLRESPRTFVTAGMVPDAESLQLNSISYVSDKYVHLLSRPQFWTECGVVIRGQGKKEAAVGNLRTLMVAPCCPSLIFSHAFPTSPLLRLELWYHLGPCTRTLHLRAHIDASKCSPGFQMQPLHLHMECFCCCL